MISLQVLTPSRKCIYNCPFCIAKAHNHNNDFENIYEKNYKLWKSNYIKILKNNIDLKTIVITGTNEPTQDEDCIKDIIKITKEHRKDVKIELQTRCYKENIIFNDLDVVAFSVSEFNNLKYIKKTNNITRIVIILTDSFDEKKLSDIIKEIKFDINQLTFKVLQKSEVSNNVINKWIENHKASEETINQLKKDIKNYKENISILFDENCMDSKNRYKVFREDGNLYNNFEEKII